MHSAPVNTPAAAPSGARATASLRPAATLVVVRDDPLGMQVLLLRRIERSGDRSSGAFVFPGGVLDTGDRALHARCLGMDDAAASVRLGVDAHGLDFYIGAIRECFEESGLLFACDAAGTLATLAHVPTQELMQMRAAIRHGETSFGQVCERLGLLLAVDRLAYYSHWLTPPGLPKRFDTRFFVAMAPPGQHASFDRHETLEHRWVRPADALSANLKLPNPTEYTLRAIASFASAGECFEHAQNVKTIARIMPRIGVDTRGPRPVMPDEPAYAEIGRIDPDGTQGARCDIVPGRVVRFSECVWRVTAGNGNMMTGPGTNTYFVGAGDAFAVIDPGPDDPAHLDAIVAAAPGPIRAIFVTHTHKDHSPAAAKLKARTGAPLHGMHARHAEWQDASFVPDRALAHGERIPVAARATLRVVHTPGHASNHLCYLLEEEGMLFTGDHVMQGSTVVINPPDGDMAAYIDSLRALLAENLQWLAPGHGFLIDRPHDAIERLIRHRLAREAKVIDALRDLGPVGVAGLLAKVYADVPVPKLPVAQRSLTAHLLKLEDEGRAMQEGPNWRLR